MVPGSTTECQGGYLPRMLRMLREQRGGHPGRCPPFAALLTGRFDVLAVAKDVLRIVEALDPGETFVGGLAIGLADAAFAFVLEEVHIDAAALATDRLPDVFCPRPVRRAV